LYEDEKAGRVADSLSPKPALLSMYISVEGAEVIAELSLSSNSAARLVDGVGMLDGWGSLRCFRPAIAAARVRRSYEALLEVLLEPELVEAGGLRLDLADRKLGVEIAFGRNEWFLESVVSSSADWGFPISSECRLEPMLWL
jgi:hypothetical protein